jgi:PRC-barrel domain
MVGVEGIAEWIGRDVVDRDGEKVGKLEEVYYDTTDQAPTFVDIKSGAFGRSHSVAPLAGATLSRDYVRLDATKELIKDAPQDAAGGRLTGVDATAVLRHFGLPVTGGLDGESRVCFQTATAADETERKRAEVEAAEARDAAGVAGAAAAVSSAPAAPPVDEPAPGELSAPAAGHDLAAVSTTPDDDDAYARLAELERRVAALEARR